MTLREKQYQLQQAKTRLAKLLTQRDELKNEFKIDFIRPNDGGQKLFFENAEKQIRDIYAGNRFGKSFVGILEDISWCLGERRFYKKGDPLRKLGIPAHGVKLLVVAQTWDKVDELFTSTGRGDGPKGKLMEYCPNRYIVDMHKDNQGRIVKVAFRYILDGKVRDSIMCFATVQSFLRNEMVLESSDWDAIHIDEPVPRDLWVAVSRGLVDRKGKAWRLLTPLEEMWMYNQSLELTSKYPNDYWMYQGSATENGHVSGLDNFYATLSEEELACRRDGRPMAMGRLVIHAYREEKHLLKGCPKGWESLDRPPKDVFFGCAIDTHPQTAHAALIVAITKTDAIFCAELFEKGSIEMICRWLKSKPYFNQIGYFLLDPSAWIVDQTTGRCYADIFLENGIRVQKGSKKRTEAIQATNEAFFNEGKHVWIHESLVVTRREIAGWVFGKENKPLDRDDHEMECMGRLIMHDNLEYHEPPEIIEAEARLAVNKDNERVASEGWISYNDI